MKKPTAINDAMQLKHTRWVTYLACLVTLACWQWSAKAKFFDLGDEAVSPNGKSLVRIVEIGGRWWFEVKNQKTGQVARFDADCNPIHALLWSQDSKTVLIVQQASEGTFAGMIHFNGERWSRIDIFPTEEDDKHELLLWNVGARAVQLHYLVIHEAGRDKEGARRNEVYRCNFKVSFATGRRSHLKRVAVSDDEIRALKSSF